MIFSATPQRKPPCVLRPTLFDILTLPATLLIWSRVYFNWIYRHRGLGDLLHEFREGIAHLAIARSRLAAEKLKARPEAVRTGTNSSKADGYGELGLPVDPERGAQRAVQEIKEEVEARMTREVKPQCQLGPRQGCGVGGVGEEVGLSRDFPVGMSRYIAC